MDIERAYTWKETDPLALARAFHIPFDEVALRVGVTTDWARRLARDPRQAARVRRAVLEIALENERFAEAVR